MRDFKTPPPGKLIQLDPDKWGPGAVGLVVPQLGFTDTDFMGRPYTWMLIGGRVLQIPPSHISRVL